MGHQVVFVGATVDVDKIDVLSLHELKDTEVVAAELVASVAAELVASVAAYWGETGDGVAAAEAVVETEVGNGHVDKPGIEVVDRTGVEGGLVDVAFGVVDVAVVE